MGMLNLSWQLQLTKSNLDRKANSLARSSGWEGQGQKQHSLSGPAADCLDLETDGDQRVHSYYAFRVLPQGLTSYRHS